MDLVPIISSILKHILLLLSVYFKIPFNAIELVLRFGASAKHFIVTRNFFQFRISH